MVLAVEVQPHPSDTSLLSIHIDQADEDFDDECFLREPSSSERDTSNTSRGALENTRLVDTQHSILNITDEEDEGDEEDVVERSFLFADLMDGPLDHSLLDMDDDQKEPLTPPMRSSFCDMGNDAVTKSNSSLFDLTQSFVEGLCFVGDETDKTASSTLCYRHVENDLIELLGCADAPDVDEMEQVWTMNQAVFSCAGQQRQRSPVRLRPKRTTLTARAQRVHRIRCERLLPDKRTGLSPTMGMSPTSVAEYRSRSMDQAKRRLFVEVEEDDLGYDSDPGDFMALQRPDKILSLPTVEESTDASSTVQDTLNLTWTLTWHPIEQPPQVCSVWMERGTLIHSETTMLEPTLMWRPAYRPHLTNPRYESVRLLNLCRILKDFDRSLYPLARPQCSLLVKTADNGDYLFEAASEAERDDVLSRWKLAVARFATLAIMEDMPAIVDEFFAPMSTDLSEGDPRRRPRRMRDTGDV